MVRIRVSQTEALRNQNQHVWHDICGKYRFETLGLWNFGTHQYISFLRSSPAQELCDLGTLVTLKHLRIQYLWYLGTSGPFQLWHMPYYNTFGTAGLWDLFNSDNFEIKIPSGLWDFGTSGPTEVIYLHSFLSQGSTRII